MAVNAGLSRRSESSNDTVHLVVAIIFGIVAFFASVLLVLIVVRRRGRDSRRTLYQGHVHPMALYNPKSNTSTSSSLFPDMFSDWYQRSPLLSRKRFQSHASTRSSPPPETNSSWYHPSRYLQALYNKATSDARPSLPEMNSEQGHSSHYLLHSRVTCDSSTLQEMNGGLDHIARPVPIHRTIEEDIISNNPTGQYRVPISRPASQGSDHTPAGSSFCFAGTDVTPSSDNRYLSHRPSLPPFTIPTDTFILHQTSPTPAEEQVPSKNPARRASCASSAYSQTTAHSPPSQIYLPIQANRAVSSDLDPREDRVDISFVGSLLRARAERNPDGLVRGSTSVSRIERDGSIQSIGGPGQSYPQRYRDKKSTQLRI